MRSKLTLIATLFVIAVTCYGQQKQTVDKWEWLTGDWKGEGAGQPGQGGGTFSFSYDLNKEILVRKSHSEYPATGNKPEIIHDDLMVIYSDGGEKLSKAIYFDNEGHIINYSATFTDNSVILTSAKVPDAPVFRLTYTLLENGMVNTKFEMSQDGVNFMTYIEGRSIKIK